MSRIWGTFQKEDGLNKKRNKTKKDRIVQAMMLKVGLGCDEDLERAKKLLPEEPEWVTKWIENCLYVVM